MNIKTAASKTSMYIPLAIELADSGSSCSRIHLFYMLESIILEKVTDEKAHRWLGWVQACICMGRGATVDELKQVNKDS